MGQLIIFEGLDGSGKATQAKLLASHLAESCLLYTSPSPRD